MKHQPSVSYPQWFCFWIFLLAFGASGCSTFNHDWKAAATSPTPAGDLQGRWQGVWQSDVNHHTGKLRCLLTRIGDNQYRARYHATYSKIMTFTYAVDLSVEPKDATFAIGGAANLGWLAGGEYRYAGTVTPTNFFSTYESRYDHGTFQMSRPK